MIHKYSRKLIKGILLLLVLVLLSEGCVNYSNTRPQIIPSPRSADLSKGSFRLDNETKICFTDNQLKPLAILLQGHLETLTGIRAEIIVGGRENNCIRLLLNKELEEEEYILEINEVVNLSARNYSSLAFGVSSLLQLFNFEKSSLEIRHSVIIDKPEYNYRAVLLDLARFWHPVDVVEETIDLLWLYKIRYLHLHLSDNRRMTFPLEDYPDLKTINAKGKREYYLKEELEELVEYARQRGVVIIPEVEFPGHSGQLWQKYPETFGSIDPSTGNPRPLYAVNIAKEETYRACGNIIRSLAEVFYTSPYIHIGGDEVYLDNIKKLPEYKTFCSEKNLSEALNGNAQELFCHFINRMHEVVKECGKETIIWEGFHGSGAGSEQISKDIRVIVWNTTYNHPDTLLNHGFEIINSTWMPWYLVGAMNFAPSVERALDWDVNSWKHWRTDIQDLNIEKNDAIIGGQICFWEQNHFRVIPVLRDRVAVMAEKLWRSNSKIDKVEFINTYRSADSLFSTLFKPLSFLARNLLVEADMTFTDTAYISINNISNTGGIRYTVSDSWDLPEYEESKPYSGEFPITEDCVITAWSVGKDGDREGFCSQVYYQKIEPSYQYRLFAPAPVKGWDRMPDFDTLTLARKGISGRMSADRIEKINAELFAKVIPEGHIETRFEGQYNQYALELKGQLISPGGKLAFKILTHDGLADMYIDGKKVFTGSEFDKKYEEFEVTVQEGKHSFTINYYYRSIQNQMSILYRSGEMDEFQPFENIVMELK